MDLTVNVETASREQLLELVRQLQCRIQDLDESLAAATAGERERKRAEEKAHLLQTLALAIGEAPDFPAALEAGLRAIGEANGWLLGEAWVPSPDGAALECHLAWHRGASSLHEFRAASQGIVYPPGAGLVGRVWVSKQPEWIQDTGGTPSSTLPRTEMARKAGLHAGFGIPVIADGQVLAVLLFTMAEAREEDQRLGEVVSAVVAQLGLLFQRKRAEEALRESERRYRELADLLPETVFETDLTGRLTLGNRAGFEQFGLTQEDFDRGINVLSMVVPHDRARAGERFALLLRGAPTEPREYLMLRKDGATFPAIICATRIMHGDRLVGIRGFLVDITERKRAEAQLIQQQQTLALVEANQRVSAAEERLRRDIAELLHGPVQTKLLLAWFRLGDCRKLLDSDRAMARTVLDGVRDDLDRVREHEIRQASHLLHPTIIQVGLVPAVRSLAIRFEEHFAVAVHADPELARLDDLAENRIPEPLRLVAYRIVEEALNNVLRHAGASQVAIALGVDGDGHLALSVQDDGRGFDLARAKTGLGLSSTAGRVQQVGGTWHVTSAPGSGTRLSAALPLAGGS